ncbi:MAG: ribonuclease R [Anaerovoracaceae bacterium]|jgi:ribonuclease R
MRKKKRTGNSTGKRRGSRGRSSRRTAAPRAANRARGQVTGIMDVNRRGYGFVRVEDRTEDIFVPRRRMAGAMNGDLVEVSMEGAPPRSGAREEGRVTRILERKTREIVGTYHSSRRDGLVLPVDRRRGVEVFVPRRDSSGAASGDHVVVEVTRYPDGRHGAEGRVTQILSRSGEPGGDIRALARQYDLSDRFPERVRAAAEAMPQQVRAEDRRGRRDLREEHIFTIDGRDARDFDDAVSCRLLDNGHYLLGVHIADVSHYVRDRDPLDREARRRGNSVYLIDQVIPMLPLELSNGICSLNPQVDRLTLTCEMEIDSTGRVLRHDIYPSVIRSCARLVYDDISDLLENNDRTQRRACRDILDDLQLMRELAEVLRRAREARGSIDFDLDETAITLDEQGVPVSVGAAERRTANRMIEEFMLLANETVAHHFALQKVPFVYRVHDRPEAEKMRELATFLHGFGVYLDASGSIRPAALQRILSEVRGREEENIISTVILRSMQKALYATECRGHFGLALQYYCHFTSPIRRYPDLMVHRIIKAVLAGEQGRRDLRRCGRAVGEVAVHSSETERQAIELERQVVRIKSAEYMSRHVGEEFDGIINGVTAYGLYVQLENTIEGMVRLEALEDDYYDYDEEHYRVVGRRSGRHYTLGDRVRVRLRSVDPEEAEIAFTMLS